MKEDHRQRIFEACLNELSDQQVYHMHSLLTDKNRFFVDKEMSVLLSQPQVSRILGVLEGKENMDTLRLDGLIRRGQIRKWVDVPGYKTNKNVNISLLSVLEFVSGSYIDEWGFLPKDKNQVALQRQALRWIFFQIPGLYDEVVMKKPELSF